MLLSGAAGCSSPKPFPGAELPTLSSRDPVLRQGCGSEKCLYVYVAPWCGVCRAATPMIQEFRQWLAGRGLESRVIVGRDDAGEVSRYAAEFGMDTLLDPGGRVRLQGGVPQFIVTDRAGNVLKRQAGVPGILAPPIPEPFHIWLAGAFGLLDKDSEELQKAKAWVLAFQNGETLPWPI